jgi:hypothetical protein
MPFPDSRKKVILIAIHLPTQPLALQHRARISQWIGQPKSVISKRCEHLHVVLVAGDRVTLHPTNVNQTCPNIGKTEFNSAANTSIAQ